MSRLMRILTAEIKPLYLLMGILIALLSLYGLLRYKQLIPANPFDRQYNPLVTREHKKSDKTIIHVSFEKAETYSVGEGDTRVTSRAVALAGLKRLFLQEVADYLDRHGDMKDLDFGKERIAELAAPLVQPEIVSEHWNGTGYHLRVRLLIDPAEASRVLRVLGGDPEKAFRVQSLRREASQALESVEALKRAMAQDKLPDIQKVRTYHEKTDAFMLSNLLEEAYGLYVTERYEEAIQTYDKAVASYPDNPAPLVHRAEARLARGSSELALRDFRQAIRRDPKNRALYLQLGNTHMKLGDHEEAITVFDRAIRLEASHSLQSNRELINNRAIAYAALGHHDEALEDFDRALQLGLKDAEIFQNRGISLYNLNRHGEATSAFEKALMLKPQSITALYYRALIKGEEGHYQQAISDLDKAIDAEPSLATAHNMRGVFYQQLDERTRARKDFNKAIELDPKLALAYANRGLIHLQDGRMNLALNDLNTAIYEDPKCAAAYKNRGLYHNRVGRFEKALIDFTVSAELDPEDWEIYNNRGSVFYLLGDDVNAIVDYVRAIALNPGDAGTYNNRGLAYLRRGEIRNAIGDFNKSLELDPNFVQPYNNLGNAYSFLGKFDHAVILFTEAIERRHPAVEGVYYNRGRAYYNQGLFQEAFEDFEKGPVNEYGKLNRLIAANKVSKKIYFDYLSGFRKFLMQRKSQEWPRALSEYYAGFDGVTEETVLEEARKGEQGNHTLDRLCEAYYYLGERRLIFGDRSVSEEYFRKSLATEAKFNIEHTGAKAILQLMEKGVL